RGLKGARSSGCRSANCQFALLSPCGLGREQRKLTVCATVTAIFSCRRSFFLPQQSVAAQDTVSGQRGVQRRAGVGRPVNRQHRRKKKVRPGRIGPPVQDLIRQEKKEKVENN